MPKSSNQNPDMLKHTTADIVKKNPKDKKAAFVSMF
jgi:hypothetical protein